MLHYVIVWLLIFILKNRATIKACKIKSKRKDLCRAKYNSTGRLEGFDSPDENR
jgi:hypothetical protein